MIKLIFKSHIQEKHDSDAFFSISYDSPIKNPFKFNGKKDNAKKLEFKTRSDAEKAYQTYFIKSYENIKSFRKYVDEIISAYKIKNVVYLVGNNEMDTFHSSIIEQ